MERIEIIDNFLSENIFYPLQNLMNSNTFPWYFNDSYLCDIENTSLDNYQFTHSFFGKVWVESVGETDAYSSYNELLLPIIDKPLIQYAAEEAMQAGIDTLIFITGRHKRAIEDHFDRSPELEDSLEKKGRTEDAKMIKEIIPSGVNCIFIRQHTQLGLGHAILCSENVVGEEPFAILLADDFLDDGKQSLISKLVKDYNATGVPQLGAMEIEEKEVSNYGIIVPGKKPYAVKGLKEKPKVLQAPSNLASIGRYVLNHKIFGILRKQNAGFGGEIQLADAIDKYSIAIDTPDPWRR